MEPPEEQTVTAQPAQAAFYLTPRGRHMRALLIKNKLTESDADIVMGNSVRLGDSSGFKGLVLLMLQLVDRLKKAQADQHETITKLSATTATFHNKTVENNRLTVEAYTELTDGYDELTNWYKELANAVAQMAHTLASTSSVCTEVCDGLATNVTRTDALTQRVAYLEGTVAVLEARLAESEVRLTKRVNELDTRLQTLQAAHTVRGPLLVSTPAPLARTSVWDNALLSRDDDDLFPSIPDPPLSIPDPFLQKILDD